MQLRKLLSASATAGQMELVAALAGESLLVEIHLTPKPGLVDRRNTGSHRDMTMQTFLDSASAILVWFQRFVQAGHDEGPARAPRHLLPSLRALGLQCECDMFRATGGINTHKGAIFSLGLLSAAAGYVLAEGAVITREAICDRVASICDGLVKRELQTPGLGVTAGERIFACHGIPGARGEAASGYHTVRSVALPAYETALAQGAAEDLALLQTMLHLLAVNADTNLISRGGLTGLAHVRNTAGALITEGGALAPGGMRRLEAFDDDLIARNLSPGGSADLLSATWFLANFPSSNLAPTDAPPATQSRYSSTAVCVPLGHRRQFAAHEELTWPSSSMLCSRPSSRC